MKVVGNDKPRLCRKAYFICGISRKTGYDLIRGRDVVKCHDLFLWRIADGPALDTLDETLSKNSTLA